MRNALSFVVLCLFLSGCGRKNAVGNPVAGPVKQARVGAQYGQVTGVITNVRNASLSPGAMEQTFITVGGQDYVVAHCIAPAPYFVKGSYYDVVVGNAVSLSTVLSNGYLFVAFFTLLDNPIGVVDGADGPNLSGWALDPKTTGSIDVQVYVDGPAGSGRFAGVAHATESRDDVNRATGIAGAHGYHFAIPDDLRYGAHDFYLYGINSLSGGHNPELSHSPFHFAGLPASSAPVAVSPPTSPQSNPAAAFIPAVTQFYLEILGHGPDAAGLALYTAQMASGVTAAAVRGALASGAEAHALLDRVYQNVLRRPIDPDAVIRIVGGLTNGGNIIDVRRNLAYSAEARGNINRVFQEVLGRAADEAAVGRITAGLAAGVSTIADLRYDLAHCAESRGAIDAAYIGILNRSADAAALTRIMDGLSVTQTLANVRQSLLDSQELVNDVVASYEATRHTTMTKEVLATLLPNVVAYLAAGNSLASVQGAWMAANAPRLDPQTLRAEADALARQYFGPAARLGDATLTAWRDAVQNGWSRSQLGDLLAGSAGIYAALGAAAPCAGNAPDGCFAPMSAALLDYFNGMSFPQFRVNLVNNRYEDVRYAKMLPTIRAAYAKYFNGAISRSTPIVEAIMTMEGLGWSFATVDGMLAAIRNQRAEILGAAPCDPPSATCIDAVDNDMLAFVRGLDFAGYRAALAVSDQSIAFLQTFFLNRSAADVRNHPENVAIIRAGIVAAGYDAVRASYAATPEVRALRALGGGGSVGAPAAVSFAGKMRLFAVRADGAVMVNTKDGDGNDEWRGWSLLGPATVMPDGVSAVVHAGILHVFARGLDSRVYVNVLDPAGWRGWSLVSAGALKGRPSAVSVNNVLYVYGTGLDDQIYVNVLDAGGWRGWALTSPGSVSGSPSVVSHDGTQRYFVRGLDGRLWMNALTGGRWSGYVCVSAGVISASPSAAVDRRGILHVVVRGVDAQEWEIKLAGGAWSGFTRLAIGAFDGDPAIATDRLDGIAVFVRASASPDTFFQSRLFP